MTKAQPWQINGVGFDAREAAREAARRQGQSLGEWLHGVIADHAEDRGKTSHDLDGQGRIEAVTARLERLGARSGVDNARRNGRARLDQHQRSRSLPTIGRANAEPADYDDGSEGGALRGRGSAQRRMEPFDDRDDGNPLLDEAITTLERRASRTEERTGQALASMAKLLEETQARREQEYNNVATLTRKLEQLESNLSQRAATASDNPIQGSLARLEARLDAIARREKAEAGARLSADRQGAATRGAGEGGESIQRLEQKLNAILEAIHQPNRGSHTPQASPAAMAAVQNAPVAGRRSLGDAIADIARRQRLLDDQAPANDDRSAARGGRAVDTPHGRTADPVAAGVRGEMGRLGARGDESRRDTPPARAADDRALVALRADIGALAQSLGNLAPRDLVETLEGTVATLAERIETSRQRDDASALRPIEAALGDLRHSLRMLDPRDTMLGLEHEVHSIGEKVDRIGHERGGFDDLRRQMEALQTSFSEMAARPEPFERVERQVAALAERLDDRFEAAVAEDRRGVAAGGEAFPAHFEKIDRRLDLLATRLDQALDAGERTPSAGIETTHLEDLVRDLGLRFEAARSSSAGDGVLDALQRQIDQLSARFERSEDGLSALPGLAASMRDLFADLEATRTSVEASAATAAREVLRASAAEAHAAGATREDDGLQAMRDAIEARTDATLNGVHDLLEKVVGRLVAVEHEVGAVKTRPTPIAPQPASSHGEGRPVPPPHPARAKAPIAARPAVDEMHDILLGGVEPRLGSALHPPRKLAAKEPVRSDPTADGGRRSDFIAAARRAAATAQAEAASARRSVPSEKDARAGLLARSRDYVATHKRPMLMSLAALVMALGTLALVARSGGIGGLAGGIDEAARSTPPAKIAVAALSPKISLPASASLSSGALTPSALPKSTPLANPIPGSDPIQTGSIPSLPSFAAGVPAAAPRPMLPRTLVAAADGGNAAAEYELATRYADGRQTPRDMRAAANLFQKAADAGVAPAQYRLASLYEKGIGVAMDKARARALYTQAAEAGNPRAMHNLAVMLADGDGHPDYAGAVNWFRKAAQYGVHDSQFNLGVLLARGLGAPQNFLQSYQWFAIAAAANDAEAEKKRAEVETKLSAADLDVAKALAASFRPKAPDPASVDVAPPPGGWDGAPEPSRLNSARSKISSL